MTHLQFVTAHLLQGTIRRCYMMWVRRLIPSRLNALPLGPAAYTRKIDAHMLSRNGVRVPHAWVRWREMQRERMELSLRVVGFLASRAFSCWCKRHLAPLARLEEAAAKRRARRQRMRRCFGSWRANCSHRLKVHAFCMLHILRQNAVLRANLRREESATDEIQKGFLHDFEELQKQHRGEIAEWQERERKALQQKPAADDGYAMAQVGQLQFENERLRSDISRLTAFVDAHAETMNGSEPSMRASTMTNLPQAASLPPPAPKPKAPVVVTSPVEQPEEKRQFKPQQRRMSTVASRLKRIEASPDWKGTPDAAASTSPAFKKGASKPTPFR